MKVRLAWLCVLFCGVACGPAASSQDSADTDADADDGPAPTETSGSPQSTSTSTTGPTGTSGTTGADPSSTTTDDPQGSTSGAVAEPCMPQTVHGPELPEMSVPGFTVYEGLDEGIFVEHHGDFVGTDIDVLSAIKDGTDDLLIGQYDVIASGIGSCCTDLGCEELCVVSYATISTFDIEGILQWYGEAFAEETRCFGIRFELQGLEAPRCEADDPTCGPLPVCDGAFEPEPQCCQAPAYDPQAERIPVATEPVTDQACTHDGECVVGADGQRCSNWQYPPYPWVGGCDVDLAQSLCGCVQSQCQWYEQG